jgi:hypothetical protein
MLLAKVLSHHRAIAAKVCAFVTVATAKTKWIFSACCCRKHVVLSRLFWSSDLEVFFFTHHMLRKFKPTLGEVFEAGNEWRT